MRRKGKRLNRKGISRSEVGSGRGVLMCRQVRLGGGRRDPRGARGRGGRRIEGNFGSSRRRLGRRNKVTGRY